MMFDSRAHRGPDKRRSVRRKLGVPVKIDCGDGMPLHACILSDVSATGARLVAITAPQIPQEFDLLLAGEAGPRRHSVVVWRTDTQLGVRFVRAAKH